MPSTKPDCGFTRSAEADGTRHTVSEGKKISLEGLLTRSYSVKGKYESIIFDGKEELEVVSDKFIPSGSLVKIEGTIENFFGILKLRASFFELMPEEESKEKYKLIQERAEASVPLKQTKFLINDKMMEQLKPKIELVARKLYVAQKLGRNIVIRFHNDGDGISGALSLSQFLRGNYIQNSSAVYTVSNALRDLSFLQHTRAPLLVFVDFGNGNESKDGVALLKAGGIELISIDHHPPFEGIENYVSCILNPWIIEYSESSSSYTAGYLCAEISKTLGNQSDRKSVTSPACPTDKGHLFGTKPKSLSQIGSNAQIQFVNASERYARISLTSDKSDLIEVEEEIRNTGIVLNYIAAHAPHTSTLEFYSKVLSNPELFSSILLQAREKIDELIRLSRKSLKEEKVGLFSVFHIGLGTIVKKHEFPGLGKSATQVFEALIPKDKPAILIAHGPEVVVLRLNDFAVENGADGTKIVASLKENMKDFIENGGGHARAAALRVKEGFEKNIIDEIIHILSSS